MNFISKELTLIIPYSQLQVTAANLLSYTEVLEKLSLRLSSCPGLYETDGKKEHPVIFHYFYSGTDIYICEYDRQDTMFGFNILNDDLQNAEWGYTSVSEIRNIPLINIDYHFPVQSIEAALYKRNPEFFKKPLSVA